MIDTVFAYLNQDEVIKTIVIIGSVSLFFIGLFGLLTKKHIIKIFLSISIMEMSLFLLFIGLSFQKDFSAPIIAGNFTTFTDMNDPIPHAMILTAIVIGMAVVALGVSFAIEYYKLTGITDIDKMDGLKN